MTTNLKTVPIAAAQLAFVLFGVGCSREQRAPIVIDAHVMPSCPFSAEAMRALVTSARSFANDVELRVHYVGASDPTAPSSPFGAKDLEAAKFQLCTSRLAQRDAWLTFLECQAEHWEHPADYVDSCAGRAGVSLEPLRECASGAEGQALLRASLAQSQAAHVNKTPTLFVDGKLHTRAPTERLLARAVCDAQHSSQKTPACTALGEQAPVAVTIVNDASCPDDRCGTGNFTRFLHASVDGVQLMELDARSSLGAQTANAFGLPPPFAVFDASIETQRDLFERLKAAGLAHAAVADGYVLPLASANRRGAHL